MPVMTTFRRALFPLLFFLTTVPVAFAQFPARGAVEVTYLANEGFLLAAGESRVLIDALFTDGLGGYQVLPEEKLRRVEEGGDGFSGVDLVLATHYHADHFDPDSVSRHLKRNPGARFISTVQAVEKLREVLGSGFAAVAARVTALSPREGERETMSYAGIRVTALHLHHGLNRQPLVEHVGFLIELGGLKLLHLGDTEVSRDELGVYALGEEGIDVAFVPYWRLLAGPGDLEEIHPRYVVAMHVPHRGAPLDYFAPASNRDGLLRTLAESCAGVWVASESMVSRRYPPDESLEAGE